MKQNLDQRIVNTEFERLRALNYFPMDEGVQNELKRALNSAPNEIVMSAAVNEWMETQSERPTPADIYRGIREQVEKGDAVRYWKPEDEPTPRCAACHDSGLAGGTKTEPWAFCECQRGRARQHNEPDIVDKSNVVREKMFAHKPLPDAARNTHRSAFTPARERIRESILTRLDGESPR